MINQEIDPQVLTISLKDAKVKRLLEALERFERAENAFTRLNDLAPRDMPVPPHPVLDDRYPKPCEGSSQLPASQSSVRWRRHILIGGRPYTILNQLALAGPVR